MKDVWCISTDLGPGESGVYPGTAVSRRRQRLLTGGHQGAHHLRHIREQDMCECACTARLSINCLGGGDRQGGERNEAGGLQLL